MRFLSLFSGIEAASAAWAPLGWHCVAFSEIEPMPCALLAQRYPTVPNLGDITKISEDQIAALGRIDVMVFGSPCQDLSIAGKQKGFTHDDGASTRSGLYFTAMRIVDWARQHCGLRFALWENVVGAFSSNAGRDFAAVVDSLAGLAGIAVPPKGWGTEGCAVGSQAMVEWSTLDAQWFGVAQRRRRVFALADFGDWANRPPILLEPKSLRGDSAPSREAGQEVAGTLSARPGGGGGLDTEFECLGGLQRVSVTASDISHCLNAGGMGRCDYETETMIVHGAPVAHTDTMPTLRAAAAHDGPGHGARSGTKDEYITAVLASNSNAQPDEMWFNPHASTALTCSQNSAVCITGDVTHTLRAEGFDASEDGTGRGQPIVAHQWRVRRLTPVECERLMGQADGYTAVDVNFGLFTKAGKPKPRKMAADGPRYKALGNSMAVPVMAWIGRQIDNVRFFQ